jgi:N-acetylglucosamine PTS system EIICBA or EIICB component
MADQVAGEIRAAMGSHVPTRAPVSSTTTASRGFSLDPASLFAALGGAGNVRGITANASRLCVDLADTAHIAEDALRRAGVRSLARLDPHTVHLIVGPGAPDALAAIKLPH